MLFAFGRLWTVLKAALAIGLLAVGSLYSANVVDQKGLNPFAAVLGEPVITGSIKTSQIR